MGTKLLVLHLQLLTRYIAMAVVVEPMAYGFIHYIFLIPSPPRSTLCSTSIRPKSQPFGVWEGNERNYRRGVLSFRGSQRGRTLRSLPVASLVVKVCRRPSRMPSERPSCGERV